MEADDIPEISNSVFKMLCTSLDRATLDGANTSKDNAELGGMNLINEIKPQEPGFSSSAVFLSGFDSEYDVVCNNDSAFATPSNTSNPVVGDISLVQSSHFQDDEEVVIVCGDPNLQVSSAENTNNFALIDNEKETYFKQMEDSIHELLSLPTTYLKELDEDKYTDADVFADKYFPGIVCRFSCYLMHMYTYIFYRIQFLHFTSLLFRKYSAINYIYN